MKNDLVRRLDVVRVIRDSISDLEYLTENDELVDEINELPSGLIHCGQCNHFLAYTENFKRRSVPKKGADGDCRIRILKSDDPMFNAVGCHDFCSYAVPRKDNSL